MWKRAIWTHSKSSGDHAGKSSTVSQGQHGFPQTMPEAIGSNVFLCGGNTTGTPVYEGLPARVSSLGLEPHRDSNCRAMVSTACSLALCYWRSPGFLTQGVLMGTISARKVITTDASLVGWAHEGRTVRRRWVPHMPSVHKNYLELLAIYLALKNIFSWVRDHHVLVRSENTTVVANINSG